IALGRRSTVARYSGKVSHVQSMPAAIASVGISSTADRQRAYQSRSSGLHGASAKPQLLITTLVTPCQHEQLPSGSQATCASMCVWPSMKPGETIRPSASIVRLAAVVILPISTMRPSAMPISPEKRCLPEPSTIVPPRMTVSSASQSVLVLDDLPVGILRTNLAAAERVDV